MRSPRRIAAERGLSQARCTSWELLACGCGLALLGAAVFGSHVANGGFYNDDWAFAVAYRYRLESGLFGAVEAFDWLSFRPIATLYWPFTHWVFGVDPSLHLAWVVVMAVAMSAALYWLLRTLGMERVHAAAVAALVLIFPASDANRLWAAASIALPGITLYLVGTVIALHGLGKPGRRVLAWHAAAVTLYVLSVMTYEIAAGAILVSLLLYRWRAGWSAALSRWLVDVAVVGTVLLLVTSGSWNEPQPLETVLRHARTMADQSVSVLARAVVPFGSPEAEIVMAVLALIAATGLVVWRLRPPDDPVARALRRWLLIALAAGGATAIGYAIFVTADFSYLPLRPGQFNRVNGLAAIGFVLLIYALAMVAGTLVAGRARRWREWSTGFALMVSLVMGGGWIHRIDVDKAQWSSSAEQQQAIVDRVERALPKPPARTTIYTVGAPAEAAPGVPVFAATWDLAGALSLMWDDSSLAAYPGVPGTRFVCGRRMIAALNSNNSFSPQTAPYGKAVVVDVAAPRAFWIDDLSDCRRLAGRFSF
jgi:hypothetical protein